jgi:hypothetical protein
MWGNVKSKNFRYLLIPGGLGGLPRSRVDCHFAERIRRTPLYTAGTVFRSPPIINSISSSKHRHSTWIFQSMFPTPRRIKFLEQSTSMPKPATRLIMDKPCIPTADPNDPLNLPKWRKFACLISVVLFTLMGNASILMPAPFIIPWTVEYGVTPQVASTIESYPVLMYAIINLIWVPFALKFGRRPTWLLAVLIFTILYFPSLISTDYLAKGCLRSPRISTIFWPTTLWLLPVLVFVKLLLCLLLTSKFSLRIPLTC